MESRFCSGDMFEWKRFWCPTTEGFSLSDAGFLYDPDSELSDKLNPHATPFERIHDAPCLVLLGEPGIGKSTAIEQEVAAIGPRLAAAGDALGRYDLGEFGDERRLIDEIFGSPAFTDWAAGSYLLHLFLDGLDECGLLIPQVAKILHKQLSKFADRIERLRLRIACRTADWPQTLTEHLGQLWGSGALAVYELAPLRRKDAIMAADASGLDGEKFLDEVIRAEAQALAIKPVTLNFLIQTYKRTGGFPAGQAQLYDRGCRLLCEETNPDRKAAKLVGHLSPDQRQRVAELIAAATVFCNRSTICIGGGDGGATGDDLLLSHLVGGSVTGCGALTEVDERAIEEVIGTGLFSSGGLGRMRFAHRTYAEFLAASYLAHQPIDDSERLKMIRHADDQQGRVVPQLRETAAWLAGFSPNVFEAIALADPQVLLRSDILASDAPPRLLPGCQRSLQVA